MWVKHACDMAVRPQARVRATGVEGHMPPSIVLLLYWVKVKVRVRVRVRFRVRVIKL